MISIAFNLFPKSKKKKIPNQVACAYKGRDVHMHAGITHLEAADVVGGPVGAVEEVGRLDGAGAGADEDVAHEGDAGVDERRDPVRPEQAQIPRDDGAPVVTHHEHLLQSIVQLQHASDQMLSKKKKNMLSKNTCIRSVQ